jgi:hypothetical protein
MRREQRTPVELDQSAIGPQGFRKSSGRAHTESAGCPPVIAAMAPSIRPSQLADARIGARAFQNEDREAQVFYVRRLGRVRESRSKVNGLPKQVVVGLSLNVDIEQPGVVAAQAHHDVVDIGPGRNGCVKSIRASSSGVVGAMANAARSALANRQAGSPRDNSHAQELQNLCDDLAKAVDATEGDAGSEPEDVSVVCDACGHRGELPIQQSQRLGNRDCCSVRHTELPCQSDTYA